MKNGEVPSLRKPVLCPLSYGADVSPEGSDGQEHHQAHTPPTPEQRDGEASSGRAESRPLNTLLGRSKIAARAFLGVDAETGAALRAKILARVIVSEGGCWLWPGAVDRNGYGAIKVNGKKRGVHRASFMAFVRNLEPHEELDHAVCQRRICCNPLHMEPVDSRTNILRGNGVTAIQARKTVASCGHPFTGFRGGKQVTRCCIPCQLKREREWARRKRAAKKARGAA